MSLASILPQPALVRFDPQTTSNTTSTQLVKEDDGGAFPENKNLQYPLGIGLAKNRAGSNALSLQYDAQGKVRYDMIAKQGHRKDKVIHTKLSDTQAMKVDDDADLQRPDEEAMRELTEKTRAALEKQVHEKVAASLPVKAAEKTAPAQYIRYTPSQQGPSFNSGAKQRIIRMVEMQVDPMEPPKFRTNKKIPRGPPSPPAPVLHSPNRKLTAKEQQDWKVPPCVSNWKNNKGYTIPLDKRLAADGRSLQSVHINENFARLAESLFIADRKAREAVETRARMEKQVAVKDKQRQEDRLRQLASKARNERAGIKTIVDDPEMMERDRLREERHKDRARERNINRAAPDKQAKLRREKERDISEQIALGMPVKKQSDDSMFDQRLFNQSKGLDSGFAQDDEAYAVYTEPWRKNSEALQSIYRPGKNLDNDLYGDDLDHIMSTKRFVADREFTGTDHTQSREGPVQFERDEEDPFGLDKFLTEAKKGGKRKDVHASDEASSSKRKR